LNRRRS
jgi:hypothetical protein